MIISESKNYNWSVSLDFCKFNDEDRTNKTYTKIACVLTYYQGTIRDDRFLFIKGMQLYHKNRVFPYPEQALAAS